MQALALLGNAFVDICTPASLAMMVAGVAIGIVFGSIPGLSASMAVALMLPLTFSMTPSMGLNTLVAVYIGGILHRWYFRRSYFRHPVKYARYGFLYCNLF